MKPRSNPWAVAVYVNGEYIYRDICGGYHMNFFDAMSASYQTIWDGFHKMWLRGTTIDDKLYNKRNQSNLT